MVLGENSEFTEAITKLSDNVICSSKASFDSLQKTSYSAIFIDSVWRDALKIQEKKMLDSYIVNCIEKGVPVIAFGDKARFLSDLVLSIKRSTGNGWGVTIPLFNVTINAYAYLPTINVSFQHFTSDDLKKHAITVAKGVLEWVKKMCTLGNERNLQKTSDPWRWVYEWGWYSYDSWKPKGRFNMWCDAYKLTNDGSPLYNWYDIMVHLQTIGGYSKYGSNWRTADTWTHHDLDTDPINYVQHVVDYDPTTTCGATTVSVSVGVTEGTDGAAITAQKTWSYSVSDVEVIDQSDKSEELVAWWHNINEKKNVGKYTYLARPGYCFRYIPIVSRDEVKIYNDYKVRFMKPIFREWWWKKWTSPLLSFYTYF